MLSRLITQQWFTGVCVCVCACVCACVCVCVCNRELKRLQSGIAAFSQPGLFTLLSGVCIPLSHFSMAFHEELPAPGCVPAPQQRLPQHPPPSTPPHIVHTYFCTHNCTLHLAIKTRQKPAGTGAHSIHQQGTVREKEGGEGRDHMHRSTAGGQEIQPSLPCLVPSLPLRWRTQVDIRARKCQSASHRWRTETSALVCLEKLSAHSLTINQRLPQRQSEI